MNRNAERQRAILEARQHLSHRPLFLDTETTGLEEEAQIVEICIVDEDGGVVLESLVKPVRPIPADVVRIHGITNAMVKHAPTWPEVWPSVEAALTSRRVVIYNADFDVRIMKQSHAVHRLPWTAGEDRFYCLMKLYARFYGEWSSRHGGYRWQSLENAIRQCGLLLGDTHRARADALLARALMQHLAAQPC